MVLDLTPFPGVHGGPRRMDIAGADGMIGSVLLDEGRQSVRFTLPRRPAAATITLEFSAAVSPLAAGLGEDSRELAAQLRGIDFAPDPERSAVVWSIGGSTQRPIDGEHSRLLARLQIDQAQLDSWLGRGRSFGELVASRIGTSDCSGDEEWLLAAYAVILQREPDSEGKTYYLGLLREGRGRALVAGRLLASSP